MANVAIKDEPPSKPPEHAFAKLTPDYVLQAVEAQGFETDGRMLALNSYENRVYQVGLEDAEPVIVKFYRPDRWSADQIQEEHDFTFELEEHELSAVTPWLNSHKKSLLKYEDFMLTVFPRRGGRAPELDNLDNLYTLGQCMGRMHLIGQSKPFKYRTSLDIETYGQQSMDYVLEHMIPDYLREAYESLCNDLLLVIRERFAACDSVKWIRTHTDCHIGNILWRDDAPHFVDFDDARMAPAIQDLWMLLSGDRFQQTAQMSEIIEGYEVFQPFNTQELKLIEPLRTLRMMHYCAWLSRRWDDPAFPLHFSWFNTERYWGEHILELREQFAILQEPTLQLAP